MSRYVDLESRNGTRKKDGTLGDMGSGERLSVGSSGAVLGAGAGIGSRFWGPGCRFRK